MKGTSAIKRFYITHILLLAGYNNVHEVNSEISHRIIAKEGMPNLTIVGEYQEYTMSINETNSNVQNNTCGLDSGSLNLRSPWKWVPMQIKFSSERQNTILGNTDERYTVHCSAKYLTRWTSNIVPRLPAKYGHPNRFEHLPFSMDDGGDVRSISNGTIYNSQFSVMLPNATSGYIQCESVENASIATKVFIFVQDGFPFVQVLKQDEFQPPIITDTSKDFYLPCVANYQNLLVQLVRLENYNPCDIKKAIEKNVSQSDIIKGYDPQIGFLMKGNDMEEQHYRCRGMQDLRWAKKQRINRDFYNPYLNKSGIKINLEFHIGTTGDEFPLGIWCSTGNDTLNQIKMITCNSQYECDWLNDCFYDTCKGNEISRKSAIPYQRDKSNAKENGIIVNPFTRGKVICVSALNPGIVAYEYLFTGLDRHRYWLSSQAHEIPKRAIIYMPETDAIFYTNKPAIFGCETSNFILLSNIKFAAMFKNGSKLLLDKINATRDPAILIDNDLGFSRKEIVVNLTKEMTGIMCLAPWLNSSEWVNTSRTFEARDVQAPQIISTSTLPSSSSKNGKLNHVTFYQGDKTRSLYCNATGEPQPSITWIVPPEHVNIFNSLQHSTLHFPVIHSGLGGKYKCVANNSIGSDSLVFDVAVKPPNPRLETTTIIGIVATFVALLIGLVVSVKKYFDAKKKIRNLTPEEVKEFLYGNPDIWKKLSAGMGIVSEDGIQSMAFNPEYEISASDLSLDESSVLGEGQFGKVIQGRLRNIAVAVKTTKPNADVPYFLALLSELKIMAYIAKQKHAKVVEFFGAVVSEIEHRKVFIVVELSPFGNLQDCLIQINPSNFLNLINEDESLSLNEVPLQQIKQVVSTLNLISWCEQIASGMEFLARKKVIHGDLATRNVLMFDNDVVKITDFGLSRKLYESPHYVKKNKIALPVAWMAIESLRFMQFSSQSDVWSFAVTVWEIFSMGEVPYAGIPSNDFVKNLTNGMRLEKPKYAPKDIHTILLRCWELEPSQRPSFSALQTFFAEYLKTLIQNLEEMQKEITQEVENSRVGVNVSGGKAGAYHTFGMGSSLFGINE